MTWFVTNIIRFQEEKDKIEKVLEENSWLKNACWKIDGHLICEVEISVGDRTYPVTLRYNTGFPNTPPSVIPKISERWSSHQYGPGGELCLAIRSDNWIPTYTGIDMLRSAYDLLEGEAAVPDSLGTKNPIPSAHKQTLGQDFRFKNRRFIYSADFKDKVKMVSNCAIGKFKIRFTDENIIFYSFRIAEENAEIWTDPNIPDNLGYEISGFVVNAQNEIPSENVKDATAFVKWLGITMPSPEEIDFGVIVYYQFSEIVRAFRIYPATDKIDELGVIHPDNKTRLDPEYINLNNKRIGLIGCGSLGSKVASMLTRAGVSDFTMVDADLFLPENIVRNELDWSMVGEHKAHALARKLKFINAKTLVTVKCHNLGGQESGTFTESTIKALSKCDLIIDATADAQAFNFAAAAAFEANVPMLWAEVYGGGIGGLIARSRPGIEPSPCIARSRFLDWCSKQDVPIPENSTRSYEDNSNSEIPEIADDADVSSIASALTRLIIDTLIDRQPSYFAHPAYLIGLRKSWVFREVFDTIPIEFGPPEKIPDVTLQDRETSERGIKSLIQIIESLDAHSKTN